MTSTVDSIARDLLTAVSRARLHITGCALACLWGWARVAGVPLSFYDVAVVALGITFIYQWNRVTDLQEDRLNCPDELALVEEARPRILALGVGSLVGCLVVAFASAPLPALALLALTLLLGYFYSSPLLPGKPKTRLKSILLIKNLVPAYGWSSLTVLYPALTTQEVLTYPFWPAFASMMSVVLSVEIVWDIRDQQGDRAAGVDSLPLALGPTGTTRFFDVVNGATALTIALLVGTGHLPVFWLFFLVNSAVLTLWIRLAYRGDPDRRPPSHSLILVETAMVLAFGLLAGLPILQTTTTALGQHPSLSRATTSP